MNNLDIKIWDDWSEKIDEEYASQNKVRYYFTQRRVVKKIVSLMNDKKNKKKSLELGCGSGIASAILAKKYGYATYCLDYSKAAIKVAKKHHELLKVHSEFIHGDIFTCNLPENKFDLIFNVGVIEHYTSNQIKKILDISLRVLKKGGLLFLGIPNEKLTSWTQRDTCKHITRLNEEGLKNLLALRNFINVDSDTIAFGDYLFLRKIREHRCLYRIGELICSIFEKSRFLRKKWGSLVVGYGIKK